MPSQLTRHPRRRVGAGWLGPYLSILGLTLTNPMIIVSFGALFAGLGVTVGDSGGAALVTAGVFLGSGAWWLLLTTVGSALRTRVTAAWVRRINVASGVAIGVFAVVSIASAPS